MEADRVDYVLDANVIMAILIGGKAYHRDVLSNTRCCSIDFVYDEINKYEAVIQTKAKLSKSSLQRFVFDIFGLITVVPSFVISDEDWQYATGICQRIDTKDIAYVALSKAIWLSVGYPRQAVAHGSAPKRVSERAVVR